MEIAQNIIANGVILLKKLSGVMLSCYPYIVRHQLIIGFSELILMLLFGGLVLVALNYRKRHNYDEMSETFVFIFIFCFVNASFIFIIDGIERLFNPNYFVINYVLKKLCFLL